MKTKEFEELKESSVGHSIIKAGRVYNDFAFNCVKDRLGIEGLRPSHLQLFPHIPFNGTTVVELAKKMGVTKQAISELVKDLISFKVLIKKENLNDKRSFIIKFNEDKQSGIYMGVKFLKDLDSDIIKLIGKKNAQSLNTSLLKIIKHYKENQ